MMMMMMITTTFLHVVDPLGPFLRSQQIFTAWS
jgi:hypothetical protein